MSILDAGMQLSKNKSNYDSAHPALKGEIVTASTATQVLSNYIDQGSARDLGAGEAIYPYFESGANGAALTGGTSITAQVVGSDDAAGTVNPVVLSTTLYATGVTAIPLVSLTANALFPMSPIIAGVKKRYITGQLVCAGDFSGNTATVQIGFVDKDARPQLYVQPSGTPTGHNL